MKLALSLLLLISFSSPILAQSVDDLVFITENYPPLNFEKEGKVQGIAVDLMVEMLALAGAKKTRADIKVQPWARGYDTAQNQKNTVLFAMTRTTARENLFKWVGPIMPSRIVLVAKKSRAIKVKAIEDLNQSTYKIGTVREDVGEQLLLAAGTKKERIAQTNSGLSLAKMLNADRIDMSAYGAEMILWDIKESGYATADYEELYTFPGSQQQYFAFHKDTDDKVIGILQTALDQLKTKGKFNEILARYR